MCREHPAFAGFSSHSTRKDLTMKQINTAFLALTIIFGTMLFGGCGGKEKPAAENKTSEGAAVAGFRSAQWGMTAEEVKKGEKLKLVKEDSTVLIYSGEIYGKQGEVFYSFDESGTLFSATAKFKVSAADPEGAVSAYNTVKSALVKELGKPSVDEVILLDSTETDDLKIPESGITTGNKIFTADWNDKPGSQIGIILSKPEKSELSLGVVYQRK